MNPVEDGERLAVAGDDDLFGEETEEGPDQRDRDAEGDREVGEQPVADDRAVIDAQVDMEDLEAEDVPLEVDPPPAHHALPRPRARGARRPPVPTKAMIAQHGLEQHVNYAAWCAHCVQASALGKQHAQGARQMCRRSAQIWDS